MFPLPMAPKTLRHKTLPGAIMRNIGGLNRSEGGLDGLLPAGHEEDYTSHSLYKDPQRLISGGFSEIWVDSIFRP
jgi:hypothetical protein